MAEAKREIERHLRAKRASGFLAGISVRLGWRDRLRALLGRSITIRLYSRSWPTRTSELAGVARVLRSCDGEVEVATIFARRRRESDADSTPPVAA